SVAQRYPELEKAEIIVDPFNKTNISGNLQIAFAWGELLRPPSNLTRGVINLKEAMNRYTKINTELNRHLLLGSNQLLQMPFVFVTSNDNFNLTETEKENVRKFFDLGGFMVLDNPEPRNESSRGAASLKQMLRDTIPNARFQPIPKSHELYHCFFDFTDGPPNGSEIGTYKTATGANLSKQRLYLEGVWYNGRLVAVYSDKGYIVKWNDNTNNEPQLKIGVNMIVYALTQEGGMVR
ncbi:DUF4159 domain-containing protein, partial [Candidatus Latescibacterota bacterium]